MSKNFQRTSILGFAAFALWALPSSAAEAQTKASVTHVWFGEADLDDGGELGSTNTDLRAGYDWSLGRGSSLGLSVGASFRDYDFGKTGAGEFSAPWGDVTDYSIGLGWRRPVGDDGLLYIAPMVSIARGDGADWGDSIRLGGILSYGYRFSDSLTIGIGGGVFTGLEETSAFPVLLIDWQISENWRLGNPFRPGPSGPAGLEIVYTVNPDWEVALGGGWRSDRFRLDEDGLNPNGIGEVEGVPVFLRLSWAASDRISIDVYAGQFLSGEVTAENRKGKKIGSDDLESAPVAALGITARF